MLGLAELGGNSGAFIGAFYPVGSNLIVLNKTPLRVIEATRPELYKYYCFSIILHEYLHSIGILDERSNRITTYMISKKAFGENHPVTLIATDLTKLFPEVIYASMFWIPAQDLQIEIVEDFDSSSIDYIG